jgi:hypothetical protein
MTLEQALQGIAEGEWHDEGMQWREDDPRFDFAGAADGVRVSMPLLCA